MDPEYFIMIFLKCDQQDHPQDPARNHFSGTHGQAVEAETLYQGKAFDQQTVSVDKYQRNNDRVGDNRADGCAPFPFPQGIGAERTQKRGQRAENNIGQGAACQDVA